jgi:hypothetical protein
MNISFTNLTTITPCLKVRCYCFWYSGGLHAIQADFTDIFTQTHATAQCFVLGMAPFVTITQLKKSTEIFPVLGRLSINNLNFDFEIFTNVLETI